MSGGCLAGGCCWTRCCWEGATAGLEVAAGLDVAGRGLPLDRGLLGGGGCSSASMHNIFVWINLRLHFSTVTQFLPSSKLAIIDVPKMIRQIKRYYINHKILNFKVSRISNHESKTVSEISEQGNF